MGNGYTRQKLASCGAISGISSRDSDTGRSYRLGKKDIAEKLYTENNRVFADIVNYMVYDGAEVVHPADLMELGSEELMLKGEDKQQRYRDVMKKAVIRQDKDAIYMLVSLENQSEVHYAMPVRNMLNDAMRYMRQVEQIRRERFQQGRQGNQMQEHTPIEGQIHAEFLSGMTEQDKLLPIITIVILFQDQTWNGPKSIHEMLNTTDPAVLKYVQDYKIHVIAPADMTEDELRKFQSSMREVLNFIKYSKDKRKLAQIMQADAERFKHMEREAVQLLNLVTGAEMEMDEEEEVVNMCKAIQDMRKEEREIGQQEGRTQMIQSMLAHGYTLDEVMEVIQCEEDSEEAGKGCKAIQDMREEERELGWQEGKQENKRQTIRNMLSRGYAFVDIMSIAECSEEEIVEVQKNMR